MGGALILGIRIPLKGSLKGVFRGSKVGLDDIGALVIRIGFWGPLYYTYSKFRGLGFMG